MDETMYYAGKMKKIYYSIITAILIYGLLCPQALWAEDLPDEVKEGDEKPLVSFDKYEDLKLREEELLKEKQNVEVAEETLINEKIQNTRAVIETYKYFITKEEYLDEIMKIVIQSKEDDEKNINIEFRENKDTELNEIRVEYKELAFLVYSELGRQKAEQLAGTSLDEYINTLLNYLDNASRASMLSMSSDSTETLQEFESAGLSQTYKSESDQSSSIPGASELSGGPSIQREFGLPTFPGLPSLLDNLFAALDQSFNDDSVTTIKSVDNNNDLIFKASEIKDSKSETTAFVRKEINKLAEAHNLAKSAFYKKTAAYYNKLALTLEKAHWLWMTQGIDIHLYISGENEAVDSEAVREIIEKAVAYLYENVPNREEEQALRNEILELEKTLRAEYIDPALESYKDKIQKASLEFSNSINEEIKVLINPSINHVDGAVEVIIILPKESAK